ncbi:hypothetical protein ACFWEH_01150 [Streptomyces anulatus]|uniref:hypothetical protein n=1 Tax=Streptomyces TaxID=1883 RepID=UPI000A778014|nr:hypothetical protein [Streptomyces sp. TSRI0395]
MAAVAALSVPLGLTSSGAAAQQPAGTTRAAAVAAPLPGAHISPWGDAQVAILFAAATGATAPRAGSLFGTLTPNFDYVPGAATPPSFPTFP